MRRFLPAFAVILSVQAATAQQAGDQFNFDALTGTEPDGFVTLDQQSDVRAETLRAVPGQGVRLRGLDKVSGEVSELEVAVGGTTEVGRLEVTVSECRYPEDNPTGEAYAWLEIRDMLRETDVFRGWMVASSPALNALDHPRYDVWVIRCTNA